MSSVGFTPKIFDCHVIFCNYIIKELGNYFQIDFILFHVLNIFYLAYAKFKKARLSLKCLLLD